MGIVTGIGLLLFSNGRILTVRELRDKPQYCKTAGMISFPVETFDKNQDRNLEDTLSRILQEELGIREADEVSILGIVPTILRPIPAREDIDIHYGLAAFLGNPNRIFTPEDTDDVEIAGWMKPEKLYETSPIRVEVRPVLDDFFSRKK